MKISGSVVFVTGANRGLGLEFSRQLLAAGAKKVYAAARDIKSVTLDGVEAVEFDVTHVGAAAAIAAKYPDVTLVINNAGIAKLGAFVAAEAQQVLREQIETNVFGVLNVSQAFAPVLAKNGGGAIINLLSILSWVSTPAVASYGVSKAAAWGLTNGLRHELREQGTQVVGVHAGFIDTDMTRAFDVPKATPEDVVRQTLEALEANAEEVFVDAPTRQVHGALSSSVYLKDVMAG